MANQEQRERLKKGVKAWNEWREENPNEVLNLEGADLHGAHLRRANLQRVNLRGADLRGADLAGANLLRTNLQRADLRGANLRAAILQRADLRGANLERADMTGTNLLNGDGTGGPDFTGANLTGLVYRVETNPNRGFLDLAGAKGLDSDKTNYPELAEYISAAFDFAHSDSADDVRKQFPTLVENVTERIKYLRSLYPDNVEPPAELVQVVRLITDELIGYLKKHPDEIYNIRSRQFEELIAEVLASYGWDVQLTPATRDGGYDIFGISKDISGVRTSWIIECKKPDNPKNKIGVDIARALYGVKSNLKVANAMLATTSHFTKGVKDFKASRYDFELTDYAGVLEWINTYRPNPNGKLYLKDNKLVLPSDK